MTNKQPKLITTDLPFVTASGIVRDINGNPLEGVNIYLQKDPMKGTTTNAHGEFVFPAVLGVLDVVFSYQGNEVVKRASELQNQPVTINVLNTLPEANVNGKSKRKLWPYLLGAAVLGLAITYTSTEEPKHVTL